MESEDVAQHWRYRNDGGGSDHLVDAVIETDTRLEASMSYLPVRHEIVPLVQVDPNAGVIDKAICASLDFVA